MFKNFIFLGLVFLFGCATPIQYAPHIDLDKNRNCPPDKACIYVIRPAGFLGSGLHCEIDENSRVIGITGPKSYLSWQRDPGMVHLESRGENTDSLDFPTEAGHSYYILQTIEISGENEIRVISKEKAQEYLAGCHSVAN